MDRRVTMKTMKNAIDFDLLIRRYGPSAYQWQIAVGPEEVESDLCDSIVDCLQGAGQCFESESPVRLAVCYDGTAVGTYWPSRLRREADIVARGIVSMLGAR